MNENRTIQHDGTRNFFGGRNLMPGSRSPVFAIGDAQDWPVTDTAVVGVARLADVPAGLADTALADYSVLEE